MKIGLFGIKDNSQGKLSLKDSRLDLIESSFKSANKTYVNVELVDEAKITEAEIILVSEEARLDLLLKDLEFVESRLSRAENESEKKILNEFKTILEKEGFLSELILTEEAKKQVASYSLLTLKPVFIVVQDELQNLTATLKEVIKAAGFITFFTANEKEARAWLVKSPFSAWEAAGKIHSDIQRGFIRAEVISADDLQKARSVHSAKQAGALQIVQKDYTVKDGDLIHFRFNV